MDSFSAASVAEVIALLARTTGITQHLQFAADLAQRVLALAALPPLGLLLARVALALIAVQQEDGSQARIQYQTLQPHAGTSPSDIVMDHLLGLLAATAGDADRAAGHFEASLAFTRKGGYRPELAWTCCDYADLLLQRNGPGDQEKAMALLDESLAIAQELGMRPLAERALSRRKMLKA
jgi:tetratricopeptide (TPR) repeat protein